MNQSEWQDFPAEEQPLTEDEFAGVFRDGFGVTVRFLTSRGIPVDSAEEIAQAAWAKGWECRGQLRRAARLVVWVNSIAKNMSSSEYRRQARVRELQDVVASQMDLAPIIARSVLKQCRPGDRHVLCRRYIEGYTNEEIAGELGLKCTTVRVRLLRIREAIAKACRRSLPERSFDLWQFDSACS